MYQVIPCIGLMEPHWRFYATKCLVSMRSSPNSFITAMDGNGYKFSGNSIKIFYYFWKEVTFILHQKKLIHMDSSSQ